ncbi:MAG: mechanosensitive ion channel family protein [Bacteroidales bacterium]|nr:mechanosensitive ion channel family protein [Bacteroidales bacterium]MCF8391456.1 mechanosensitive ion channel family protein [Bacteroidales bacterium]
MNGIADFLRQTIGISPENQSKVIYSILIITVLGLARYGILKIVWRFTEEPKARYTWRRSVSFTIGFLTLIIISGVWIQAIGRFGAFLGLFTAGLAIALKDPLTNIAGWIFILVRTPFSIGDRVQIGENAGDVIDIRLFQFSILEIGNWVDADQSTGRIIHVPNGQIFTVSQANYTAGFKFIWNELKILITFESNWEKAKELLIKIANEKAAPASESAEVKIREASKKYMIFYQYLTPIVYTKVEDSGVLLSMRYICDPLKRRTTEHEIWEDILRTFHQHDDIDFAYPTQRFYTLGKSGKEAGGI